MESLIRSRQKDFKKIVDGYRLPRISLFISLFLIVVMILYNHYINKEGPDLFFLLIFVCLLFNLFGCILNIFTGVDKHTYIESKIRLKHIEKQIEEENL